ncbi:MAG: hypothetical protein QOE52_2863 [Mycobacterium sp.]|jgi:NAD(P)-dependent dehydrogenase (short-subunit alcohol dehydrogenase family)|nr:hypothetical protein [Mycobacterium sp.]MDT5286602.1 hypothetical protein [Mycobacterium sp.]MDT5343679.1 hypothetical protein [Mycobacterium sp.]MDT5363890.1 hypothetical protein [Mycobacterium sp.]
MTSPGVVKDLQGKVALVTGATSGIGRAVAGQLAAQGARVVAHGRDATRGADVVAEIEKNGGSARFVRADLSDPAEALRLANEAGEVEILVNNAGVPWFGPTEKLDAETLDQLFAANVQAPYLLVTVLAPKMVARGSGVIINMASRAGTIGQADSAAYGATKAALASFARSWAAEYAPGGVRVNSVSPGPVYTGAAKRQLFDVSGSTTTLLGRAGEPSEIADLVGYLASPRGSFITSADFAIDGGRPAARPDSGRSALLTTQSS